MLACCRFGGGGEGYGMVGKEEMLKTEGWCFCGLTEKCQRVRAYYINREKGLGLKGWARLIGEIR